MQGTLHAVSSSSRGFMIGLSSRSLAGATLVATGLALTACVPIGRPAVPMRTLELVKGDESRCLAVLLPGRLNAPEKFAEAGFASAVAARSLALDLVAVDAHFGYYRDRSVVERLRLDVVAPARAAGYDTIWLVGSSLGGIGGLLYLKHHPEDLAGVFVLAPYLGPEEVIDEIAAAGGPARWRPPSRVDDDDVGRELWSWLAPWLAGEQKVPLHLGWGTADAFDRSNRLLVSALPPERVYTHPGGHDWKVWESLWEAFLDREEPCRRQR